jgi:hypothetical protein
VGADAGMLGGGAVTGNVIVTGRQRCRLSRKDCSGRQGWLRDDDDEVDGGGGE